MFAFQRLRAVLFYLSLAVFFIGLPFILSFALGYKFNPHTLQFIKTGLIFVKTQPEGAAVYLNRRPIKGKTPVSIHELLPGTYTLSIELDDYYPWKSEAVVEAGKVTRLEKIILFPLRPQLEQLNREKVSSFRAYPERGAFFYLDLDGNTVYRSGIQGDDFRDIASLPESLPDIRGWEVSSDQRRLFLFSSHQITIIYLESPDYYAYSDSPVFLDYPAKKILQVFWHSDSYHLIVVSNKDIEAIEARPAATGVVLVRLKNANPVAFYDAERDTLYFSGNQTFQGGNAGNNIYKLELSSGFYPLDKLIKAKPNE